jgi:hypothetical protein
MEKLFTVAGTAKFNNAESFRVATGSVARREYKLRYHGAEEVALMALPEPMTRAQAQAYVAAQRAPRQLSFAERMAAARAAKRAAAAAANGEAAE